MNLYKLSKYFIIRYISILCIGLCLLCGSQKSMAAVFPEQPTIIEIINKPGVKFDWYALNDALSKTGMPPPMVYQWQNHWVLYVEFKESAKLMKVLSQKLPLSELKLYSHPFYNFNRKYCSDSNVAKNWTNIILTANLVADPKMQQEYLNYHATQFQKWPEVSNGFCHANFQRLLVFKSGRQLMLVISIPRGKKLDDLNPKTTENNPRVNDWNKIMAKYQEGIAGTKKGETWVFLKQTGDLI